MAEADGIWNQESGGPGDSDLGGGSPGGGGGDDGDDREIDFIVDTLRPLFDKLRNADRIVLNEENAVHFAKCYSIVKDMFEGTGVEVSYKEPDSVTFYSQADVQVNADRIKVRDLDRLASALAEGCGFFIASAMGGGVLMSFGFVDMVTYVYDEGVAGEATMHDPLCRMFSRLSPLSEDYKHDCFDAVSSALAAARELGVEPGLDGLTLTRLNDACDVIDELIDRACGEVTATATVGPSGVSLTMDFYVIDFKWEEACMFVDAARTFGGFVCEEADDGAVRMTLAMEAGGGQSYGVD